MGGVVIAPAYHHPKVLSQVGIVGTYNTYGTKFGTAPNMRQIIICPLNLHKWTSYNAHHDHSSLLLTHAHDHDQEQFVIHRSTSLSTRASSSILDPYNKYNRWLQKVKKRSLPKRRKYRLRRSRRQGGSALIMIMTRETKMARSRLHCHPPNHHPSYQVSLWQ